MIRLPIAMSLLFAGCSMHSGSQPAQPHVLRADVYIEADYDEVWRRFTEAEAYADWYSAPCLEFGERPGDPVAWGSSERMVYRGKLEHLAKGRGLSHGFQFVGFGFDEPSTLVDIEITEHGSTVLVSLRHDCTSAPSTYAMITKVGWLKSLSRLKTLCETSKPMPWPAKS